MMDISFEHPLYLWFLTLIPLLVAIHFYSLHYVRQRAMRFANFEAIEKIVQGKQVVPKNYLLLLMRVIILVGFTLAAAGTTLHYDRQASAYDYVVALDTSSSMLAQDLQPNRMEAAKAAVENWVSTLPPGTHVGLLTFSSQANLILAPTEDLAAVAAKTKGIVPDKSGGAAICEALKAGSNYLLVTSLNPKAIVLISDDKSNAGCLLDEGIDYANLNGVKVFSVGVGSAAGGTIDGVPGVVFKLDETDLRSVADKTGGEYFGADGTGSLAAVFTKLQQPGTAHETLPLAIPIMIACFVFVFVDWGLSITRYRSIP